MSGCQYQLAVQAGVGCRVGMLGALDASIDDVKDLGPESGQRDIFGQRAFEVISLPLELPAAEHIAFARRIGRLHSQIAQRIDDLAALGDAVGIVKGHRDILAVLCIECEHCAVHNGRFTQILCKDPGDRTGAVHKPADKGSFSHGIFRQLRAGNCAVVRGLKRLGKASARESAAVGVQ